MTRAAAIDADQGFAGPGEVPLPCSVLTSHLFCSLCPDPAERRTVVRDGGPGLGHDG